MKRSLASLSLLALILAACSPSAEGPLKIGFLGPLTGDLAAAGADALHGTQMAVDEINAAGGINGRQVQLVAEDGHCTPAESASAAQKLVNVDKVIGIIGGACSSETLGAAPIAEAGKVVMISYLSSSPKVADAGEYIFRNYPNDALKGKALGNYLKSSGFKKLAMIGENTDFCQGIRDAVKKDLPAGTAVVFDEMVDQGTKDYRSLFTRLKDIEFDVFLANGQSDSTVAEMAKQMRALGMKQQIVGTDTADSLNLAVIGGDAVEGLKPLSVPTLSETDAAGAAFMKNFKEKHGEAKFGYFFAALAYDGANLLMQTIGTEGADGAKIKDAFYSMKPYVGIAGTFSFDSTGDVKGIPFAMKEFKGGKLIQSQLIPIE